MDIPKDGSTIQSLKIGIALIDIMMAHGKPMRFNEIQDASGMTKSNLYKYMNTLTQLELLMRENSTGLYHFGPKLIQYGAAAIGNQDTIEVITPYLQKISEHTNCSVLFAVATTNGPVIAKIWQPSQSLNIGAQIGTLLPINSSSGKIFNVFHNKAVTENWRLAANPAMAAGDEEFKNIMKNKIAFASEPLVASISSVSIPILNYSQELVGTLTMVGFTPDIPKDIHDPISRYLLAIQKEVSKAFGYSA